MSIGGGGGVVRAVDPKPRSREPRVMFHTICLGNPGKCHP